MRISMLTIYGTVLKETIPSSQQRATDAESLSLMKNLNL